MASATDSSLIFYGGNMLVTTTEFKTYYGFLTDDPVKEAMVDRNLQAAQEVVEKFVGYPLEEQSHSPIIAADGSDSVDLGVYPVTSIETFEVAGADWSAETYRTEKNILTMKENYFPRSSWDVEITFTAGYTSENAPSLVKASILRIAGILQKESGGNVGVNSVSDPNSGSRSFTDRKFNTYLEPLRPLSLVRV